MTVSGLTKQAVVRNASAASASPAKPARAQKTASAERATSNQVMQQQLIQAKLSVSEPGDHFEQEADRVADQVMRMTSAGAAEPPPSIQRACTSCADEMQEQSVQRMCDECEEEVQRKPQPGVDQFGSEFNHPASGGQSLPASERSFFEPRFGRDFSNVRIHADAQAGKAAKSVSALAYTMGNDVVFGAGRYQPGTTGGRTLLAHELAHVVQQGAAGPERQSAAPVHGAQPSISTAAAAGNTPSVQRLGDVSQRPSGLLCDLPSTSGGPVETDVLFSVGDSTLTPAALADIGAFIGRWNAAGADDAVRIDGFASTDGPEPLNWNLSCDRAMVVEAELMAPSSGAPGIPPAFLEKFAHGETSEFSAALPPNRRATISADLSIPPPPVCANPGVTRVVNLQPVFMRTDPADAAPTGVTWNRRLTAANDIWGKLGVTFNDLGAVTIDTALKSTGGSSAEQAAIAALRTGTGVEVFLADNDVESGVPTGAGGATTFGPLAALCDTGKIVMADRGTSDTLLAHELGHILGIQHPGTPPNPGEAGTIMVGSGSHSVDNSTRNTIANFNAILCPPATGSTCLNPDP